MTSKKNLVIAVLATFCLTATLFMIIPTRSSTGISDYDPWCDVNDDGSIDMLDISIEIDKFMTSGDPTKNVNVTNWPEWLAVGNVTVTNLPSFTTYAKFTFALVDPLAEVTLFNISGPGKLRYLMLFVYCENYVNDFAGPFRIFIDEELTMEIDPGLTIAMYASKGQLSVPRLILELYDTTNWDFKWGVELESYFEHSLVITYINNNYDPRYLHGVNAFLMYEA